MILGDLIPILQNSDPLARVGDLIELDPISCKAVAGISFVICCPEVIAGHLLKAALSAAMYKDLQVTYGNVTEKIVVEVEKPIDDDAPFAEARKALKKAGAKVKAKAKKKKKKAE